MKEELSCIYGDIKVGLVQNRVSLYIFSGAAWSGAEIELYREDAISLRDVLNRYIEKLIDVELEEESKGE